MEGLRISTSRQKAFLEGILAKIGVGLKTELSHHVRPAGLGGRTVGVNGEGPGTDAANLLTGHAARSSLRMSARKAVSNGSRGEGREP